MDTTTDAIFGAYPTRCMLGLVASLALLIALTHLPIQRPTPRVGWTASSSADRIRLSDVVAEESAETDAERVAGRAPPPTGTAPSPDAPSETQSRSGPSPDTGNSKPGDSGPTADRERAQFASTLDASDQTPRIVGGKGSLYLNLNYPEEARAQGIEGRLELEFLVQPDGSVTDIEVASPLHPLCDSAAVDGIRSVEFIPAKVDGDPVPIRLRLPIRFKISSRATAGRTSPQDS
ncbi:MAG: energy transducer TonB [Salinibacter sp.]|uniref:energy transducer TonB n=1 Tax=Salinibacter sp. TaxID=2065818 RepID=UPI002FC313B3